MKNKITSFKHNLEILKIQNLTNERLSDYTTIGVGGNAALVVVVKNSLQLEQVICLALQLDVPYLIIGKGSNLIISDKGFNGVVVINRSNSFQVMENKDEKNGCILGNDGIPSDSRDLPDGNDVLVHADSGIQVRHLTNLLYKKGIVGLQWFAGIPASVGGAIYMNMHGGKYFFGDFVNRVLLLSGREKKIVDKSYFKFGYDYSILHNTKEIILCAELILQRGDVVKAQQEGKNWAKQKSFQPQKSAGCVFHNLTEEQQKQLDFPTSSVGYVIDKVLKLSGTKIGDAVISTKHAAFIENVGNAKANDVYKLIKLIKDNAKSELNINLELEVELIGDFES